METARPMVREDAVDAGRPLMGGKSAPESSLAPSLPTPLMSENEARQQRIRLRGQLVIAWFITIQMAGAAAGLTWISFPLRPRNQLPLGLTMLVCIGITAAGWCVMSWFKYPHPSLSLRTMQRRGLWVMTGVVIYQAALPLLIGRISMLGFGGIVGMGICVVVMWIFFLRGRESGVR